MSLGREQIASLLGGAGSFSDKRQRLYLMNHKFLSALKFKCNIVGANDNLNFLRTLVLWFMSYRNEGK